MHADRTEVLLLPVRFRGQVVATATIDTEDVRLTERSWRTHPKGYVQDSQNRLLHREVMNLNIGDGLEVDHVNLDKLDNRRGNLRLVTHAQNRQNNAATGNRTWRGRSTSSQHRGVTWDKSRRKWKAMATVGGESYNLGRFATEAEAVACVREFRTRRMPFSAS